MTDASSAAVLPGTRPAGTPPTRAAGRLARRAAAGVVGLCLLSAAHPPAAGAQRARVASASAAVGRPTVPAAPSTPSGTAPDPRLAPDEVVGIVLEALAQADEQEPDRDAPAPGSPVALVFAFASPGNRAAAGSLERFESLVRDDAYRPLLHHRRAARGAIRVDGERATQRVVVTTAAGDRVAYTFVLGRQGVGAQRGCWLTESVTREAPSRLAAPFSA